MSASRLHAASIVIDAVAPLLINKKYLDVYRQGGVTAVAPTVDFSGAAWPTLNEVSSWLDLIRKRDDLLLIRSADDVLKAKKEGKLGIILHFQGTEPIEKNLNFVNAFKAMGVGIIQLTYNERCRVGDGCEVPEDSGLTKFGTRLIERLNECKVIVDCSHTGYRTTREAIDVSASPVVVSHANCSAIFDHPRNLPDDLIKAIGSRGGLIGASASPQFTALEVPASLEQFVAHIDHMVQLIGVDSVALGLDYYVSMHPYMDLEAATASYNAHLDNGSWDPANYRPPPYIRPSGIETPDKIGNLTDALSKRYDDSDVKKILGENWLRIYRQIWS